jgi:isochorismate synthase
MNQVIPYSKKRTFENPSDLWKGYMNSAYSVAIWRYPNSETVYGILDLRPDIEKNADLEKAGAGFYINPFLNHHPSNPQLIKGDLFIKWRPGKSPETYYNPVLSDQEIIDFHEAYQVYKEIRPKESQHPQWNYLTKVALAVENIKQGTFDKVVLSRFDEQTLPDDFDLMTSFENACIAYPNAFVYVLSTDKHGCWFGATPETLLEIDRHLFKTVSLAGTQKLAQNMRLDDVAWTEKDIEEQAMVSRYIIDCFKKIRLREFVEIGPKTIKAGNLAHLKTEYNVDMSTVNLAELGSIMIDLLHPTSAVCGMPLPSALEFIKFNENYDRELYAGFLGPINIDQYTHLFVNLRCMKLTGNSSRFYAGAGITRNSNPQKEFEETQLKMETLKSIIFK